MEELRVWLVPVAGPDLDPQLGLGAVEAEDGGEVQTGPEARPVHGSACLVAEPVEPHELLLGAGQRGYSREVGSRGRQFSRAKFRMSCTRIMRESWKTPRRRVWSRGSSTASKPDVTEMWYSGWHWLHELASLQGRETPKSTAALLPQIASSTVSPTHRGLALWAAAGGAPPPPPLHAGVGADCKMPASCVGCNATVDTSCYRQHVSRCTVVPVVLVAAAAGSGPRGPCPLRPQRQAQSRCTDCLRVVPVSIQWPMRDLPRSSCRRSTVCTGHFREVSTSRHHGRVSIGDCWAGMCLVGRYHTYLVGTTVLCSGQRRWFGPP